uniref:Uncharacterized protein n=1 Tax=Cacopsylla melanoneura TaxID=428564 RepID=A0A8D9EXF5_9HEMI
MFNPSRVNTAPCSTRHESTRHHVQPVTSQHGTMFNPSRVNTGTLLPLMFVIFLRSKESDRRVVAMHTVSVVLVHVIHLERRRNPTVGYVCMLYIENDVGMGPS